MLMTNLMIVTLLLLVSACGKIPDAYRGDYVDPAQGATMNLTGTEGAVTLQGGRQLKANAEPLEFDALSQAKPGIYLRTLVFDPNVLEVFFLFPKNESRKEESGFVWMESEIFYSRMNAQQENAVPEIKMLYCERGTLLLDVPSKTWNGGCPPLSTQFEFKRK